MKIKVLMVFGTRPEAIKMAPLARRLLEDPAFDFKLCVTAQHRDMLDQVLDLFGLSPDIDLNIMKLGQDLHEISTNILFRMKVVLREFKPEIVLVHGDTATTLITSLAAYYERIAVGHVEAGLRTASIYSPWPEEGNRRMTTAVTSFHFAPTEHAKASLLRENVVPDSICVTGNTVIDALLWMTDRIDRDKALCRKLLAQVNAAGFPFTPQRRFVLITGHRRENFGGRFVDICQAIKHLAIGNPAVDFVYPVHMNPNVRKPVFDILSGCSNLYLLEPQDYAAFVFLMMRCHFILTDSGGIQEEGPALGKPVLVMRDTTERPEAIVAGTAKLVGTSPDAIVAAAQELLNSSEIYSSYAKKINPFGDGRASGRIVGFLRENLNKNLS